MKSTRTPPSRTRNGAELGYAQCWEDADVLLEALRIRSGASCLSIGSGGDNSFSLLAAGAERVVALDLNPAQIACIELRRAAYRELEHRELLELVGSRASTRREVLYRRCRPLLRREVLAYWDSRPDAICAGIGHAGKFERFFTLFRRRILPLVHGKVRIAEILEPRDRAAREQFYERVWNTVSWRLLFHLYFSRGVMGRLGRYPRAFRHVEGKVASRILARTRHAVVELEPWKNPYLNWILEGQHRDALPHALRKENYERIRENLDGLEVVESSLQDFAAEKRVAGFDAFNLSDVFEYVSAAEYERLLESLLAMANPGARFAYWNMLVPRERPASLASALASRTEEARRLFAKDKAFFYSEFVIEEHVQSG